MIGRDESYSLHKHDPKVKSSWWNNKLKKGLKTAALLKNYNKSFGV